MPPARSRVVPGFSEDDLVRWAWTEPSVWTNSMLETLEQSSVRGGKWHSLIDKVYKRENLLSAYREVAANKGDPGVDHVTVEDFGASLIRDVPKLEKQLRDGTYLPQAIKRVHIPESVGTVPGFCPRVLSCRGLQMGVSFALAGKPPA